MIGPVEAALDGDVRDLLRMMGAHFPGWVVVRTDAGWWAHRGGLVREALVPDGRTTHRAATPVELYARLGGLM